ncbi:MAG: hypothetical protein M0007_02810 [Actinomycetota bacterium]|jgi:uncharacterized protein (TIGR00725 family)|nr:hypothetical protein [Actinomycetota bacterium]
MTDVTARSGRPARAERPGDDAAARPALAVGVMGSASGEIDPGVAELARVLGGAIARAGCTLVTGACPGLPQQAVLGASTEGGLVLGISPALSEQEHVDRYGSPTEGFDALIYTGSGLMGREVVNIRSSDIVVIVGGHSGTLGEFAIAYDEGRLIGVLGGTGGVADLVDDLVPRLAKETGAKVLFDDDPVRLVDRLVDYYRTVHFRRPHSLYGGADHEAGVVPPTPA